MTAERRHIFFERMIAHLPAERQKQIRSFMDQSGMTPDDPMAVALITMGWTLDAGERVPNAIRAAGDDLVKRLDRAGPAHSAAPAPSIRSALTGTVSRKLLMIGGGIVLGLLALGFIAGSSSGPTPSANEEAALEWARGNNMEAWLAACRERVQRGGKCQINLMVP